MTAGILTIIAIVALIAKDFVLAAAAFFLVIVSLGKANWLLDMIHKPSFSVGLFCLMVFILIPIAKDKIDYMNLTKEMLSWKALLALLFGFIISYIGGKGIGILPAQPVVLLGVTLGTLLAVLFTNGLPAGLIIAAGCIALLNQFISL